MSQKIITPLIVLIFFFTIPSFAEEKKQIKPSSVTKPVKVSQIVVEKIKLSTTKLDEMERLFVEIETKQVLTLEGAEKLEKAMNDYAEAMITAFDAAQRDAEEYANSKGERGTIETLEFFERNAKVHESRLNKIESKADTIQNRFRDGKIKLDRALIQKLTPPELNDIKQHLSPQGIKEMEKLHPDIFKAPSKPGASLKPFDVSLLSFVLNLPEQVSNFFVGQAEARVAASCISPCVSRSWTNCYSCIASKGPEARQCVDDFRSCWKNKCKWYKPWECAKCIGKLIWCLG